MSTTQLILKIAQNKIWYNETEFVPMEQTNIPYRYITFPSYREIYWLVVMTNFNRGLGRLCVDVLDYNCVQRHSFSLQAPKSPVKLLVFGKFNWNRLEPLLIMHQKSKFLDQLLDGGVGNRTDRNQSGHQYIDQLKKLDFEEYTEAPKEQPPQKSQMPTNFEFSQEFDVDFEECIFQSGCVRFEVYVSRLEQTLELTVDNAFILPEFDNIKIWFSKKLNKQEFKVIAHFKVINSNQIKCSATSEDIDKIDSELIEGVKIIRTQYLTKTIVDAESDKSLFTADDIYSLISESESNVFRQNESDILDILMDIDGVRNKAELQYLSKNMQSLSHRIRFTTKPLFGFLFTMEGKLATHFIWELLESHATYIWSFVYTGDGAGMEWEKLNSEINEIVKIGRDAYKRSYKDYRLHRAFSFNVIHHREQMKEPGDSYSKWIASINEILK